MKVGRYRIREKSISDLFLSFKR